MVCMKIEVESQQDFKKYFTQFRMIMINFRMAESLTVMRTLFYNFSHQAKSIASGSIDIVSSIINSCSTPISMYKLLQEYSHEIKISFLTNEVYHG